MMTIISCNYFQEGNTDTEDSLKTDSIDAYHKNWYEKIDTNSDGEPDKEEDQRLEVIDTLKKKTVNSLYTSKCVAYRNWRIS